MSKHHEFESEGKLNKNFAKYKYFYYVISYQFSYLKDILELLF